MRKIMFPKVEKSDVKKKLRDIGKVVTTRFSKDLGKFKVGERLEYAGYFLNVVKVERFEKLEDHPFLDELDDRVKGQIKRYGEFEVLWLALDEHTIKRHKNLQAGDSGESEVVE